MSKKKNHRYHKPSTKSSAREISKGNTATSFLHKDSTLRNLVIIPLIIGLIIAVLTPFAVHFIAPLFNKISEAPSLLLTQDCLTSFTPLIAQDPYHKDKYLEVIESGEFGTLSMNLTNNDERTMVVEKIFFDLLEYYPAMDTHFESLFENGENTARITHSVRVGTSCQDYQCDLLGESGYYAIFTNRDLPAEDFPDRIVEHIEGKGCDSIDILISPDNPGIYRFKIKIYYSLGASENCIETEELCFISFDSDTCRKIENSIY